MVTTAEERIDFHSLSTLNGEAHSFDTLALHAGVVADPTTGALLTPIYQTTTYRQEAVGKTRDSLTAALQIRLSPRLNGGWLRWRELSTVRVMQPD
jgi:O-acetylhomoserine sulfhydrylase